MKAQTIEDPVGASPACCHSERSEESLRGFAYRKDRDREILRFAQNDTRLGVGDCSSAARSRQRGLKDSINAIFLARNHPLIWPGGLPFDLNFGCPILDDFQGWGIDESADHSGSCGRQPGLLSF
jgi:hypothetical protein